MCGQLLGGKRTVDINDEQTDGILDEIWIETVERSDG